MTCKNDINFKFVSVNKDFIDTATPYYLHIVYGCFLVTIAELSSYERSYDPQT